MLSPSARVTSAFLRGVAGLSSADSGAHAPPAKYSVIEARRNAGELDELVRQIDRECGPAGWPCNLCKRDPQHYQPLADSLADALRAERRRLDTGTPRARAAASSLEQRLEDASLYANVRWSCSTYAPATPPIYPQPIDRAPHTARLR